MITEANNLIDNLQPNLIKGIIPLHEYIAKEWIEYGLISQEFVDFFRANPYGETDKYTWEIHKVDALQNLYIRRIS